MHSVRMTMAAVMLAAGGAVTSIDPPPTTAPAAMTSLLDTARSAAAAGHFDQAIALLTDALAREPGRTEVYHERALALSALDEDERALSDLARVIRDDAARRPAAILLRGEILLRTGRYAGATTDFSRVIRLDPASGRAFWLRSLAHECLDLPGAAKQDRDRAHALGHDAARDREAGHGRLFSLNSWLQPEERRTSAAILKDAGLAWPENEHDLYARALVELATPEEASGALSHLAHSGGGDVMGAAARGKILLALRAMNAGDDERAAHEALTIYLSSSPADARLHGFRIFGITGSDAQIARQFDLVRAGRQDGAYAPALAEIEARRAARRKPQG